MKIVIELLRQKNSYLNRFEKISSAECHRLQSGDYSHVEKFYHSRQIILDALENIDKHLKSYTPQHISKEDKQTVQKLLQKKRKITRSILQKDILIHSYLNDLQYDKVEDQIA